ENSATITPTVNVEASLASAYSEPVSRAPTKATCARTKMPMMGSRASDGMTILPCRPAHAHIWHAASSQLEEDGLVLAPQADVPGVGIPDASRQERRAAAGGNAGGKLDREFIVARVQVGAGEQSP